MITEIKNLRFSQPYMPITDSSMSHWCACVCMRVCLWVKDGKHLLKVEKNIMAVQIFKCQSSGSLWYYLWHVWILSHRVMVTLRALRPLALTKEHFFVLFFWHWWFLLPLCRPVCVCTPTKMLVLLYFVLWMHRRPEELAFLRCTMHFFSELQRDSVFVFQTLNQCINDSIVPFIVVFFCIWSVSCCGFDLTSQQELNKSYR